VKEKLEDCEERPMTERADVLSKVFLQHKPKEKNSYRHKKYVQSLTVLSEYAWA
jgi:hypothetical protein